MGNNHHNKFSLSWLYHKLTYPKTCTTSSISISKSSFRPRLKAASPDPDTRISIPRKSYYFTRELTRETLANHFLEGSVSHKSTRKTISLKKEHVEEKSGRPVSSHSLSSTSNSINCSSPMHHRPRRHSRELQFNHVFTPDPVDKTNASLSSCTVNPNTMARDVMVGTVNPLGLFPMSTEKKKKKKKKVVKDTVTERSHVSSKGFYLSTSTKYPGMSIEVHSPRLLESTRGIQARKGAVISRRNGETNGKYEGVEVVKLTFDPWRDFRDSMAEMIVENRIKESKDLEDLLMRYLSLNSAEYHDAIIGVFKQVWCNLVDIPLN